MVGQAQAEACIADKAIQQFFKVFTTEFKYKHLMLLKQRCGEQDYYISLMCCCFLAYFRSYQKLVSWTVLLWMSLHFSSNQWKEFKLTKHY